ncbi:hypothetical protein [Halobacterium bonnevillei]|uniref:Cox cluster protein n=1 Tax=Halobacterium bonnevillei TaxID=2692200 RepID=A0A6B0SLW7_9EURY|nr:hypothetical protein [Halobacterium bonnevillei]MXR22247.1 hypothetical protein [Halobacterium bonnevillei]
MSELNTADKIAAYGGGGLVVLGVFVIGLLEMFLGSTHPVSGEGQIEHEALIPLEVRSGIILLGLLIWAAYAVYKVVATTPATDAGRTV